MKKAIVVIIVIYQSSLLSKYIKITKKLHKNPGHAVALRKDYNRQAGLTYNDKQHQNNNKIKKRIHQGTVEGGNTRLCGVDQLVRYGAESQLGSFWAFPNRIAGNDGNFAQIFSERLFRSSANADKFQTFT